MTKTISIIKTRSFHTIKNTQFNWNPNNSKTHTHFAQRMRCGWCRAPSAPHTRPTQRLSSPPPTQKLGAENHTLQLNVWCSWWWAYVPETCRAKNTLRNYLVASSWHFKLFHEKDAMSNNPQTTRKSVVTMFQFVCTYVWEKSREMDNYYRFQTRSFPCVYYICDNPHIFNPLNTELNPICQ